MSDATPKNIASGNGRATSATAESSIPTCDTSASPSNVSNTSYRQPRTVKQFAALVNRVGTELLNGTIDHKTAATFSALARTVAQAVGAEMQRAKMQKDTPDMRLDGEDDE